jgi:hypothetical protein
LCVMCNAALSLLCISLCASVLLSCSSLSPHTCLPELTYVLLPCCAPAAAAASAQTSTAVPGVGAWVGGGGGHPPACLLAFAVPIPAHLAHAGSASRAGAPGLWSSATGRGKAVNRQAGSAHAVGGGSACVSCWQIDGDQFGGPCLIHMAERLQFVAADKERLVLPRGVNALPCM